MNAIFGLLVLLNPALSTAQPILFRGTGAAEPEFRARLRADEDLRSPTAAYLHQHPLPRAREQLIGRFARAQHAYLEGEVGEARQYFQEVVALLPTDDWRIEQREVFLHAYLRLAQMEHDDTARERWLVEAQYLGQDLKLDRDVFPPPITRRYLELSRQLPRLRPALAAAGWPLILINGIRCTSVDCPTVPAPSHDVRVTFVSDQWVTQTQQVDIASLARLHPPRFSWVTGECGQADLSPAARALGPGRAFFGLGCETPHLAPPPATLASMNDPRTIAGQVATLPLGARPFYRSPWLWAGVGAAIVAAVAVSVKSARHARDEPAPPAPPPPPQPTTIYGY